MRVTRALHLSLLVWSGLAFSAAAQQRPLTLDDALRLALERSADLQKQLLVAESAEQDKALARAAILPRLDFNASASRARSNGPVPVSSGTTLVVNNATTANPYFTAGVSVTQLVFDGGKWWNNLSAADLGQQSAQAQVDEQRLQVRYLVEQRFYELVRAQRQLQVLSEAAARSRDQAQFTQRLFEGGRSTQADVYAARANRDNDEVNRLGQERVVELARADLSTAIGLDPGTPLSVAEPQNLLADPAPPPGTDEAVQRALSQRPSLKAFALTAEQGRKLSAAGKGDYFPAVSLFGQWNRSTTSFDSFESRPDLNNQAAVGVKLTWNLFNGLATQATARKAEIQALSSGVDLAAGRRGVAADVQKAIAQLATARTQSRVARQAEDTAKEGLRLARTRQEVGVGTQLEVRDAELKLTQAQLNVVGSILDGREAEAALRRAQGG